jgi:HTH-type transcriptional regulator / antitoxin HipB
MDYIARTPQQLGAVLKAAREQQGLSQAKIGVKTGFAQSKISLIENHTISTSIDILYKTVSALGMEIVLRDKSALKTKDW